MLVGSNNICKCHKADSTILWMGLPTFRVTEIQGA
jgi:hypothetical protein